MFVLAYPRVVPEVPVHPLTSPVYTRYNQALVQKPHSTWSRKWDRCHKFQKSRPLRRKYILFASISSAMEPGSGTQFQLYRSLLVHNLQATTCYWTCFWCSEVFNNKLGSASCLESRNGGTRAGSLVLLEEIMPDVSHAGVPVLISPVYIMYNANQQKLKQNPKQ